MTEEQARKLAFLVTIARSLEIPINSLTEAAEALVAGQVDAGAVHLAQAKFVLDRLLGMREEEVTDKEFVEAVEMFKDFMARVQT